MKCLYQIKEGCKKENPSFEYCNGCIYTFLMLELEKMLNNEHQHPTK